MERKCTGRGAMSLKRDVSKRYGRCFRSARKAVAFCQMQTAQGLEAFFHSVGL